jgi:hypothetical protein
MSSYRTKSARCSWEAYPVARAYLRPCSTGQRGHFSRVRPAAARLLGGAQMSWYTMVWLAGGMVLVLLVLLLFALGMYFAFLEGDEPGRL